MRRLSFSLIAIAATLAAAMAPLRADDVVVISAAAVKAPLEVARGMAVAATGHGLQMSFGTAGFVRDKVAGGAAADIVVLPPARLDELVQRGLVLPEGRIGLGLVRLGVAVRGGAAQPAIATEADIRAALLAAPSIGLADPASGATTGIYFAKLLKQMNLEEPLRPRIRLYADGTTAMEALARGEVAIAAGQISEIKPVLGVDLVGPLPEALQLRTIYAAGIAHGSHDPAAARAMIGFLTSSKMAPAFLAAGFDPAPKLAADVSGLVSTAQRGDDVAPNLHFQSGETPAAPKLH